MSELNLIILGCVAIILFGIGTLTYLLIVLFSKMYQSSKAKYSKTMDNLEKDSSFKL
jgi:hypothetical protein